LAARIAPAISIINSIEAILINNPNNKTILFKYLYTKFI
jgi:hypothetical protein